MTIVIANEEMTTGEHAMLFISEPDDLVRQIGERYANHRSGHVYGVSVRVDCRSFH
jgi:hypothetical protein